MRRVRLKDGHTEFAGRLLDEEGDGIEVGPGGELLRQVMLERATYECGTWCSREGVVYDRLLDPFAGRFVWSTPKAVGMEPATGHFTTLVGRDSDVRRSVRLVRCIAMAWVEPPRSPLKLQACVVAGAPPTAEHLAWVRTGVRDVAHDGVQELPPASPAADDTWRPLRYEWRTLSGEVVGRVDERAKPPGERYEVSARGWVRSPHGGAASRGVRSPSQRMYASVAGVGAFWVDEAILLSFGGAAPAEGILATPVHANDDPADNALANLAWRTFLVALPRHEATAAAVEGGGQLDALCAAAGVQRSTMWDRIATAATELPLERAERAFGGLASVRSVLRSHLERGELDAADTLPQYADVCDEAMRSRPAWAALGAVDRFGVVRLSRILVFRKRLQDEARV